VAVLCASAQILLAVEPEAHTQETEAIEVSIGEVESVREFDQPVEIQLTVINRSDTEIAGRIAIGGPTRGVYPIGESTREFKMIAGEQLLAKFEVGFSRECLNKVVYPIHAFVQLTDGRDSQVQVVRLIETDFENPIERTPPERGIRVKFKPSRNAEPGAFAKARINLIRSFIRQSESLPEGGLAYHLGDLALAIRPGDQGLLDAEFAFIAPDSELVLSGVEFELELPPDVAEAGAKIEVENFKIDSDSDGFTAIHELRIGEDWTTQVTVRGLINGDSLDLNLESFDKIVSYRIGQAANKLQAVAAGPGYRFGSEIPRVEPGSPLLAASYAGAEFEGGIALAQSSSLPLSGLEGWRIEVLGNATLSLTPSAKSMYDGMIRRALELPNAKAAPAQGFDELNGRIWIQASRGHYGDLQKRVAELVTYGVNKIALSIDHWPALGENNRPPDVWPPDERLGSLAELQELANYCRENGILLGLEEDYAEIDPSSDDFSYDSITFDEVGSPQESKPGRYFLDSSGVRQFLERNLKFQRYYLVPRLGVTSGARLASGFDRVGEIRSMRGAISDWRESLEFVGTYLGPDSVSVARSGAGDWVIGAAAGAGFDPIPGFKGERVPWLSLARHHQLAQFEASKTPSSDAAIANEILLGRMPFVDHRAWGRAAVRKAWLVQPVAEMLAGDRISRVSFADDNRDQLRCYWESGAVAWVNRGEDPWLVSGRVIPQDGFLVRAPDLDVSIEDIEGQRVERLASKDVWYASARPRLPEVLRLHPFVESFAVREDEAVLKFGWVCAEDPPGDFSTLVTLGSEGTIELSVVATEESRETREDSSVRQVNAVARFALDDLKTLPSQLDLQFVARARGERPIQLPDSQAGEPHSRFGGVAVTAGRIAIDGSSFAYDPGPTPHHPPGVQLASRARSADFGWTKTNGSFRLDRHSATEIRLTPLPDSPVFSATLNLAELGIAENLELLKVIAMDLSFVEWRPYPSELTDSTLTIVHDPEVFHYAILFNEREEPDPAEEPKAETEPASKDAPTPPAPPVRPGLR
jgi:hypothetical protein